MNLPQYQTISLDTDRLEAAANRYGIYFTIHLDENLNVSDFNPFVAQAYTRTVLETIRIARRLNIPVLNMHLSEGVYFTLPDRKIFLYEQYREQYLQSIRLFRETCENSIGPSNLKICIENSSGYTDFQLLALDLLLESTVFALTFDIGHDYCINHKDEPIIISRRDRLHHFHFHDATAGKNHLPLGAGGNRPAEVSASCPPMPCPPGSGNENRRGDGKVGGMDESASYGCLKKLCRFTADRASISNNCILQAFVILSRHQA